MSTTVGPVARSTSTRPCRRKVADALLVLEAYAPRRWRRRPGEVQGNSDPFQRSQARDLPDSVGRHDVAVSAAIDEVGQAAAGGRRLLLDRSFPASREPAPSYDHPVPTTDPMTRRLPVRGRTGAGTKPSRQRCHRGTGVLLGLAVLFAAGCGSPFSDAEVGNGEQLISTDLYAVIVPAAAEQNNTNDRISTSWSAAGGRITASVEQEDASVLSEAGDLTRIPTTVAGVQTERLEADLRRNTAAEPGDRIRYRVAVHRLPLPSAARPTEIEIELMASASLTEADVQTFRTTAQRFLDRVQVRGQ